MPLDGATRDAGRRGVADARAALQAARRAAAGLQTENASEVGCEHA